MPHRPGVMHRPGLVTRSVTATMCRQPSGTEDTPPGTMGWSASARRTYFRSVSGMWITDSAQQSHTFPPRLTFHVTYSLSPLGSTAQLNVPCKVQPYFSL